LILAALGAAPAAAQTPAAFASSESAQAAGGQSTTPADTETRPGLPTFYGDTGLWFVPTAETLPGRRFSGSLFYANYDRNQGLTDIGQFGLTAAFGVTDRFEVFGSFKVIRLDRDLRPVFQTDDPIYGGILQDYPYLRRGFSKTIGGPTIVGGKYNLISQSRGDAISLAPRVMARLPFGSQWSGTTDVDWFFSVVASREFAKAVEITGTTGGVIRGDPPEFRLSDGFTWGVGTSFPTRSAFRAIAEWQGEWVVNQNLEVKSPPFTAEDGSIAPVLSKLHDLAEFKIGAVWQSKKGMFVHGGVNYTQGSAGRVVGGHDIDTSWGVDLRVGWHPGVKVFVPPPPPAPVVREVVREAPAPPPPPPPPPPNRAPTFGGALICDPTILEPGQTSRCSSTATDPDGDPVTYRWTAPQGTLNPTDTQNTVFTAPGQEGNVPVTVTATDSRGASATNTATLQVVRRQVLVFEDVHFEFDRFNLRPDALKILDDAVSKLQGSPNVRITIEGHCDSIGTSEYNLALGERRANSVRDYLANRGVAGARMRTVSYGEDRPIAPNTTAQGRAMNRRGHLVVIMEAGQ